NYIMISLGDVKTPNIILGVANLINIILDPFLILGLWIFPEMGIRGAAAATVISRSAASFAGLYALFSKKYHINIKISDLKPDVKKIKKILFIGIPESVSLALDSIFQMILISFADFLGTAYVAAWGIVSRLLKIFILPGDVVGRGVAVGVGQNLGNSGLRKRLKRMSAHVSEIMLGVFCFLSIIIYFNLHSLAGIFLSGNEAETVSATVAFLKRICLAGPLVGVSKIMLGAVKGSGRTFHALLIKISGELLPKVIIAYFLVRVLNFQNGLWNAYLFASVIFFAATLFYFKYKKWDDPVIGDYKLNQEMLDRRMEKILQQRGDY
ncbi:MAG: MATE family efflux transporter, partial [Elusimicrobiota bacterium]